MIDGISGGGGPVRGPWPSRSAATPAADSNEPARAVTRVTPVARSGPGGLVAELASAPPVDRGRVEALRSAIAEGRYKIDPTAIADAMLKLERGAR